MKDKEIIQELASAVAEIAAQPVQREKRELWHKLNALKPERPMVMIDQVCWNEKVRRCAKPALYGSRMSPV